MPATALPTPPSFRCAPAEWTRYPVPQYYRGIWFSFEVLAEFLKADARTATVTILKKRVSATDLSIHLETDNRPTTFTVLGNRWRYRVILWADRIVVEVHTLRHSSKSLRSVMYPFRVADLEAVMQTIKMDLA